MSTKKLAIDLGQCDPDHRAIRNLLESLGFEVVRAHTAEEAKKLVSARSVSLVMVNRIFDADGGSGIESIGELVELTKSPGFINPEMKVILVSNYPEYQQQAQKLGAKPGFGKAQLHEPETARLLVNPE
jgi:hypothetical protein